MSATSIDLHKKPNNIKYVEEKSRKSLQLKQINKQTKKNTSHNIINVLDVTKIKCFFCVGRTIEKI
jgi:hypothetical protein